ncbi:MAG TPA: tagaturonate epimerase family protein, partial [Bacillota bacterium]|nr:tagaturonate epimerase family protein [Bacillota bacterium]
MDWKSFVVKPELSGMEIGQLRDLARREFETYRIYPESLQQSGESLFFITWNDQRKVLVIVGEGASYGTFSGEEITLATGKAKICDLTVANSQALAKVFPFTAPRNHRGIPITVGLGDRLGLASPGHLRLIHKHSVFPVLAQQSIRELNLTGRTYPEVLAAAAWAVFQEGYTAGYGADGDHLKTAAEIKMALEAGFTMITLDCSEHIDNSVGALTPAEIEARYAQIPANTRQELEAK